MIAPLTRSIITAFSGFCVAGCATAPDPTRVDVATSDQIVSAQDVSPGLKPYYQRIHMEGISNATLNRMRLASAAIEAGEWQAAARALDEVLRDVEALGPADPRSREALSHFESEEIKRFKGETHERAMAYLLRGLLYMREKQWDDARACFKSVQVHDAAKRDPALRANWASAWWLEGWCNRSLGEKSAARECWERSEKCLPSARPLPRPAPSDNALCVALLGYAPLKMPTGDYGERLSYRPAESKAAAISLRTGGRPRPIPLGEDMLAQASSRGLRHMDEVNEAKADGRFATQTAGEILTTGGLGATIGGLVEEDREVAAIGLGVMAAGMTTRAVASTLQPKADTRTWDLLPATIHILPLTLSGEETQLEFQIQDARGARVALRKVEVAGSSNAGLILLVER